MPKERIHDEAGMYDVHVGWDRGPAEGAGYVQVGVETHDGLALVEHLTAKPEDTGIAEFKGVWGTLDRAGCNRLIRVLRRARDQAFGGDE